MSRLLLLCPGQGDQHPGMFDLARTSPAASALLDRLPPVADTNAAGTNAADIYTNRIAQPLIVSATLAMWEAIREFAPAPSLIAGYSIGELSAYAVAGAIAPEAALQLAAERAQLMDDCLRIHPGQALLTITGLTLPHAAKLAADHGYHISIETGEDTSIAGGPADAAQALMQAITAQGARSTRLPVEVASHTPYMQPAVEPYAQALQAAQWRAIATPVLAGINATAIRDTAQAIATLARQLSEKITWLSCMDAAAEAGITYALELGPGSALSRMLQHRHPQINTRSVTDFRTLDGIRKWLERAAEN